MYLIFFSGKELSGLQRYILSNKITSIYHCATPPKKNKKKLKIKLKAMYKEAKHMYHDDSKLFFG